MRWLTDALYLLTVLVTVPFWLTRMALRGRLRTDWPGRLGAGPVLPTAQGRRILLHAVSVGEVNAIRTLVSLLEKEGGVEVVIASTTDTGYARAQSLFGQDHDVVRYPLDFSWSVRKFLARVAPDAVGLVELEVWPNFVAACQQKCIPVMVINGRLSPRSFRRYRLIRALLRPSFRRLAGVMAQSQPYADRFIAMGAIAARVHVASSLKWDNASSTPDGADKLAEELGVDRDRLVIVAGSTAPEEHQLLHDAVQPGIQLICAPRRPEWFESAAQVMQGCTRRTKDCRGTNPDRYLLDTIGELSQAYALADIVVIGRSFGERHGSDPAEPAGMGKPVVIGPATDDFLEMVEILGNADGLIQCNAEALPEVLGGLAANSDRRSQLSSNAMDAMKSRQGGSSATLQALLAMDRSVGE
ncbi:MAG: glycosyltransferase N-terminal domain-containing protein [Phycisphaerales bacterium]|nr:glycosyltransferase N-terminal domain-containing protein [Phycisphaerales bacterium]